MARPRTDYYIGLLYIFNDLCFRLSENNGPTYNEIKVYLLVPLRLLFPICADLGIADAGFPMNYIVYGNILYW